MHRKLFARFTGVSLLCLAMCGAAFAQYGGGGSMGMGGGTGTGTPGANNGRSYGSSGKAIGIGVGAAAGAAVGIALLIHHRRAAARSEASVIGCTQSVLDRMSLRNESNDQTYTIRSNDILLRAGERVELTGVVKDEGSGSQVFQVRSLVNDYGTCGPTVATTPKTAAEKGEVAQISGKEQ